MGRSITSRSIYSVGTLLSTVKLFESDDEANPANLTSRGTDIAKLSTSSLWWNGPHWLQGNQQRWPNIIKPIVTKVLDERVKPIIGLTLTNISNDFGTHYASFTRMIRVLAYSLRFIENIRKEKSSLKSGPLSVKELQASGT